MDFGRPFVFSIDDKEWYKKILLLSLIYLIPFIGAFVVQGWGLDIVRNVVNGADSTLPEINFESQLKYGFFMTIINIIYMLPLIILFIIPMMFIFPLTVLAEDETVLLIGYALFFLFFAFVSIISLVWSLFYSAVVSNYAVKRQFSAAFEIKTMFKMIKNNILTYLVVLLGIYCASYLSQFGIYLFIIGVFPASVYAVAIMSHFYAQAYKKANANL